MFVIEECTMTLQDTLNLENDEHDQDEDEEHEDEVEDENEDKTRRSRLACVTIHINMCKYTDI